VGPIDWLGLWAALQVFGIFASITFFVVLILGGVVYVVGGTALDMVRDRNRRNRRGGH